MSHFTLIVNCIKQSGKSPPNQYCKALRTVMYKRYINFKLIYLSSSVQMFRDSIHDISLLF